MDGASVASGALVGVSVGSFNPLVGTGTGDPGHSIGGFTGADVETSIGAFVGAFTGESVGSFPMGAVVRALVGLPKGASVGSLIGAPAGGPDGAAVGVLDGASMARDALVGVSVGSLLIGPFVSAPVGTAAGAAVVCLTHWSPSLMSPTLHSQSSKLR
jgi:hypothetical protein